MTKNGTLQFLAALYNSIDIDIDFLGHNYTNNAFNAVNLVFVLW
jgi:hypothetical protein